MLRLANVRRSLCHSLRLLLRSLGAPFGHFCNMCSLTSFVRTCSKSSLRSLDAPFGRFCNMCSLTSFIRTCSKSSLRSLDAPFGRFCNMCSLTSFIRTCSKSSLRSLGDMYSLTSFVHTCRTKGLFHRFVLRAASCICFASLCNTTLARTDSCSIHIVLFSIHS